jgi:plastocyanin
MVVAMHRALAVVPFAVALVLAPVRAFPATHIVVQTQFSFDPDDLTIEAGDTVEWMWSGGGHTVTNGVHPDSAGAGDLFDEPLTVIHPTFSFTFTTVGDVPYFCRPHFLGGMIGIVRVQPAVGVEEPALSTFGKVKNLYR